MTESNQTELTAAQVFDIWARLRPKDQARVQWVMKNYGHTLAEALEELSLLERIATHESGHVCAAIIYNIPIISVSITADTPHLHRGNYRAPADIGLECMATLCLSGPAAEMFFCGPITDGSDEDDIAMAKDYLTRAGVNPLRIGVEFNRPRASAEALVRTPFARHRIPLIAAALLRHGTLTGDEIGAL